MKKYSPSYNAFYETTINDVIPEDAVDITDEKWAALLEGQTQGKIISCGPDMRPCLNEPPLPTSEEVIMQAEVRKYQLRAFADATIQPLQDATDLEMATEDESALLIAWKKYRIQLMRVDTSAGLSIVWPDTPA